MTVFVAFGFSDEGRGNCLIGEIRCGCRGGALSRWLDLSGSDGVCSELRCGY